MCQCITVVALEQEVLVQRISSKTEIPKKHENNEIKREDIIIKD